MSGKGRLACLLSCLLLSGCGAAGDAGPAELPEVPAPEADLSGNDLTAETPQPLDTVTCLPESLIEELRDRMLSGRDTYEDFEALSAERELSEEAVAAAAPELSSSIEAQDAIYSIYSAVDFDNDGTEDIFALHRMGQGSMGMLLLSFWQGRPNGSFKKQYFSEEYLCSPLFISWEGHSYLLCQQRDHPSKDGIWQESYTGLSVTAFLNGQPQETAWLTFDPTVLWTEGVYDDTGMQTGWVEGAPEDRELTLSVYTRGVNTDFPLPAH